MNNSTPDLHNRPSVLWLLPVIALAVGVGAIVGQLAALVTSALIVIAGVLCLIGFGQSGRRRAAWCSIAVVVLVGALVIAFEPEIVGSPMPTDLSSSTQATPAKPALAVAWAWPWISGCPIFAKVAMPSGGGRIEDFRAPSDVRGKMTSGEEAGGSWVRGILFLDLSTVDKRSVDVTNIQPHIQRRDLAPPQWIYEPSDGCGPLAPDRSFDFDLDAPSFTDDGVPTDMGDLGSDVPTAPVGPQLVIDDQNHARIRIDALSCNANYQWVLDIQYTEAGTSTIESVQVGPFQSFGIASNTAVYSGVQDGTGGVKVESTKNITGSDPEICDPA